MARVSYVERENASPEVHAIYEEKLKGKPGSVQKAMAHRPHALQSFLDFYGSVGRSLERRLYEMVYLRVSMLNQCFYCTQHHLASSKRAGLQPADWKMLQDPRTGVFSGQEKAALDFAEKLTLSPAAVTDGDVIRLKEYFTDEQVVDLDLLIGLANLTNRFTGALALDLEFPEQKFS